MPGNRPPHRATTFEKALRSVDAVGGGLGLTVDLSQELGAVSGAIDQVGALVGGTLDKVLGVAGGVTGSVGGGASVG